MRVPSGRSTINSSPRIGRPSRSEIAIGQSACVTSVPSGRYSRQLTHHRSLPSSGVRYYEVPAEYGVKQYRYTVVNDRTVLVDPGSHRIVQVIE